MIIDSVAPTTSSSPLPHEAETMLYIEQIGVGLLVFRMGIRLVDYLAEHVDLFLTIHIKGQNR